MRGSSRWFKQFHKWAKRKYPHLRFKRGKLGIYRIYFKQGYIHEVFKEMPLHGHDIEEYDPRLDSRSYYEEYEDIDDLGRTIKNFKEGFHESVDRLQTRMYMMRHDKEFYENSQQAYQQMVIK